MELRVYEAWTIVYVYNDNYLPLKLKNAVTCMLIIIITILVSILCFPFHVIFSHICMCKYAFRIAFRERYSIIYMPFIFSTKVFVDLMFILFSFRFSLLACFSIV